ncbi:uncharacterized protein LOC122058672 isoform X2 [Macadamia integrifolia]|uniref:uncharacterized protein LOC122058672 isoform X2 n=1 Tax=Macadamia integrifolia TaxID=60698 RepID=UPI001C52BB43|nr:uncharacterized protein LOC122058672 isoform X2 [Macadamia integrifolia]
MCPWTMFLVKTLLEWIMVGSIMVYVTTSDPILSPECGLLSPLLLRPVLEEEDERGVAHIVEHLAFSATKKYTNHDIVKFLESNGAEFGACQNALTSADETIYELLIPVDKPLFNGTCCQSCCIFGGARISLSVFHKYFLLCIMVSSLNLLTDCSMLSVYQLDLKK